MNSATTPYKQPKLKSRDRRPLSSKHRTSAIHTGQNATAPPAFPTTNPYFIQSKKGGKKRPASANRKNLVAVQLRQPVNKGDKSPAG